MLSLPVLPPPLGRDGEAALARRIEAGVVAAHVLEHARPGRDDPVALAAVVADGREAWQEFLTANLRLAVLLAGQAARRSGMDFDDLFQEACLALGDALRRYDHARSRFTTYAVPLVRQHLTAVTSSLAGQLGLPVNRAVVLRRAQGVAEQLSQELGRAAEVTEISAALGRDPAWTARLLSHRPPVPLDLLGDALGEESVALGASEDLAAFDRLLPELARLPGEERDVLRLRFGFVDGRCHSYREIAERIGTSASSVRRAAARGLATLRRRQLASSAARRAAG